MSSSVTVDFNANIARFTSAIDKATNDLNKFQSNASRISSNIGSAFASLGVGLGVGAFAAFIKGSIDAQDHLNDLAKTTRLTVEQLAGLASASKKSGSDLDGTAKAINKLAVEMGKDAEKFKALGITAKDPLQAFGQLADVMNAIDDPQKRAAVGAAALGKSWADAAPLMSEGSKAIEEMVKQGTELSKVTTESAKAADEFNDKWEDLKTRASGWGVSIANPIIDGLNKITRALDKEINKKPGSIAEFIFGPTRQMGYTGPKDANGLPLLPPPAPPPATPGKPTAGAIDSFLGGGGKPGKAGKPQGPIDVFNSGSFITRDKATADFIRDSFEFENWAQGELAKASQVLEERARAMDEAHMARMEQIRIETEGEGAIQDWIDKNNQALEDQTDIAKDLGMTFSSAFEDAVIGGKKLSDVMNGLAQDVARIFLRKTVTEPLGNMAAKFFENFNPFGLKPNAAGGVYSGPGISAYSGQVVSSPTVFPFASGIGLMGEAGPEAILPLSRGADGKLGVSGGGVNVTIINNSRAQITQKESSANGKRELVVMIEDVVSGLFGSGALDSSMRQNFGAGRVGVLRG